MKFKPNYAYPNKQTILLTKKRLQIRPVFEEEIEVTKRFKDRIEGYFVQYAFIPHGDIKVAEIREEDLKERKKYYFFGEKIKVPNGTWVRLKEKTPVTIYLNNYRVIEVHK